MKYIILLFLSISLIGCYKTKEELVATKCRLKMPIVKAQCEKVGVYKTKGGRMQGLPVSHPNGF
jgi:hypothetical protein